MERGTHSQHQVTCDVWKGVMPRVSAHPVQPQPFLPCSGDRIYLHHQCLCGGWGGSATLTWQPERAEPGWPPHTCSDVGVSSPREGLGPSQGLSPPRLRASVLKPSEGALFSRRRRSQELGPSPDPLRRASIESLPTCSKATSRATLPWVDGAGKGF